MIRVVRDCRICNVRTRLRENKIVRMDVDWTTCESLQYDLVASIACKHPTKIGGSSRDDLHGAENVIDEKRDRV